MKSGMTKVIRMGIEWPIYLMMIGMMTIQLAAPLQIGALKSLGTWMIAGSSIWAFIVTIGLRKWNSRKLIVVLSLMLVLAVSIVCSFDLSFRNVVAAICFLEIPFFIGSYSKIKQERIIKTIFVCFGLLSLYYIALSLTPLAHVYYTKYGARLMPYLTLGYNNPNETAMHLFTCMIVLVSLLFYLKPVVAKVLVAVDIAAIYILLWQTLSRTGSIIGAAFLIMVFLFRKRKIPNALRFIALMIPVVFLVMTLAFSDILSLVWIMGDAVDTGRDSIYTSVLENMNPLFFFWGDFTFRFQNLHNGFWSVFATIGVLGLAPFLWLIHSALRNGHNCATSAGIGKFALLGLLCMVIYTATEAAFLTIGSVFAASVVSVYLLSISDGCRTNASRSEENG